MTELEASKIIDNLICQLTFPNTGDECIMSLSTVRKGIEVIRKCKKNNPKYPVTVALMKYIEEEARND